MNKIVKRVLIGIGIFVGIVAIVVGVFLYKFSSEPHTVYYDSNNGSLYFMDRGKDNFSKDGNYLYRLDLRQKFFDSLMQLIIKRETETPNEKR